MVVGWDFWRGVFLVVIDVRIDRCVLRRAPSGRLLRMRDSFQGHQFPRPEQAPPLGRASKDARHYSAFGRMTHIPEIGSTLSGGAGVGRSRGKRTSESRNNPPRRK